MSDETKQDWTQGEMRFGEPVAYGRDVWVNSTWFGTVNGDHRTEDDPAVNPTFPSNNAATANARRVAACWNALAGIPTEAVERGAVAELVAAARAVVDAAPGYDRDLAVANLQVKLTPFKEMGDAE